jgi:signal transduction histidine kinase
MLKRWFREFLVGKNSAVLHSESEYKSVVLRGNLALVGLIVGFSYIFIDRFNGISGNELFYIATCVVSLTTLFYIRAGKYKTATVLFVSVLNFIVFIFSATDPPSSGVYFFFIATCLTSFALFGYRDRKLALAFTFLSLGLFLYSFWGTHPYIIEHVFSEKYLHVNFTINFIVALITCVAIVYFLIDVNFHSEKQILEKNEQLAKANTELDRFVYSASHDMRAPLSSILGLVEVYKLSSSEQEKLKILDLIQNRANKLDDFIREILDYSRNTRLEIRQEIVDYHALVQEIIEGLTYSKDFEKIKIEVFPVSEVQIRTDPERLKVILNNLLTNSVKYHDSGKSQSFIKVIFNKNPSSWSVTIEDNGIGIKPDHQAKIFEMFYRAHESSEGSGLGLYIVKEAVERMGGTVSAKSEFSIGSAFVIEFPDPEQP